MRPFCFISETSHTTLNNMKEMAEKKPSFWKKIISRCGTRCGKSAENA